MTGDLTAAIRARLDDLDNTRWNTKGQSLRLGDVFPEASAALREVLALCDYSDEHASDLEGWQAPSTMAIRRRIAEVLEVDCG